MDNKENAVAMRLTELRAMMASRGIDAVIVPQSDPHQSEYLSAHWQVRRWFSGFTGSAGHLVVTAKQALLWTDSRYFIQAEAQLAGTEIRLMKDGLPDTPGTTQWLRENLDAGACVAVDGNVCGYAEFCALADDLAARAINLSADFDPAEIWTDRPELPKGKIFVHDEKYAGANLRGKIADTLSFARQYGENVAVFVSALDEIAWLLNIRSNDVRYNPVTMAFLYMSNDGTTLFVDKDKIDEDVDKYLCDNGISVAPYDSVLTFLSLQTQKVLADPTKNSVSSFRAMGAKVVSGDTGIALRKACKNEAQISGIRAAMVRDGVALVHAFMEIEKRIAEGSLSEMDVCEILRRYRSASAMFVDESFGTIAGFGANGAIVHYEPTEQTNAAVEKDGLLLIDSGAQYPDGTTDITRTIATGNTPTPQQRHDFTLVMKGHIALAQAIFPAGTTGHQLDSLARQFLWREGLTYLHGTGHGVGHFLNVHEGPHSIRLNHVPTPLMPGMVTSNEPGLYRENIHGIRCENLILTHKVMNTEFGDFLGFETLTLFPFDRSLLDTSIMTDGEIAWLNGYHKNVRQILTPQLDEAAAQWLHNATEPLTR